MNESIWAVYFKANWLRDDVRRMIIKSYLRRIFDVLGVSEINLSGEGRCI